MDYNALLSQLGYTINETTVAQMQRIFNNMDGVNIQNIVSLNDHLKPHLCFVAMSGSEDRLKIKNVATIAEIKERVEDIIADWAEKYKIKLEKINDTTYYIIGRE